MPHQRERGVALRRGDRRWALCAGPRAGRSGSWHGQEGDAVTLTAGIDAGSTHTKAVIVDPQGTILGKATVLSGFNFALAADGAIPELTCHAWAIHGIAPGARTILDVGGQTVKAIRVDERGRVKAFRLNDKCAAGSGAFLEKAVRYMGYEAKESAALSEAATNPATVSSICAVFAESEVINHLVAGRSPEDVCAGAVVALAERAAQLVKRVRGEPEYILSGGLTRVPLMRRELERSLKTTFSMPPDELGVYAGALGAARLAHERLRRQAERLSAWGWAAGLRGEVGS